MLLPYLCWGWIAAEPNESKGKVAFTSAPVDAADQADSNARSSPGSFFRLRAWGCSGAIRHRSTFLLGHTDRKVGDAEPDWAEPELRDESLSPASSATPWTLASNEVEQ